MNDQELFFTAFRRLTKNEAKVLYLRCLGLTGTQIANLMVYSIDRINQFTRNIYAVFYFEQTKNTGQRLQVLREIIAPYYSMFLGGFKYTLDDPIWDKYPDIEIEREITPLVAYMVTVDITEEDKEPEPTIPEFLLEEPSIKIKGEQGSKGETTGSRVGLIATLITVICIGVAVITYLLLRLYTYQTALNYPTWVAETISGPAVFPTWTPIPNPTNPFLNKSQFNASQTAVINTLLAKVTQTALNQFSTDTPIPIEVSTPTIDDDPFHLHTPTPTDRLTPLPTLQEVSVSLPFKDDFTKSYDKNWIVYAGDPVISNGYLADNSQTSLLMYIGNNTWKDYVISISETIINHSAAWGHAWDFYIGVRAQDLDNFIAFSFKDLTKWYIIDKSRWTEIPNSLVNYDGLHDRHTIMIIVKGNEFTAKIDDGDPGYFVLPDKYTSKFASGGVLLNMDYVLGIDSIRISAAP